MTEEKKETKSCNGKKKAMLAYGFIQISSSVLSAVALAVIAFSFCSLKKESNLFNSCVDEMTQSGAGSADAVRFCNGG